MAAAPLAVQQENPEYSAIAFLEMLWTDAWGLDFVAGQSGMVLSELLPGDVWVVTVGDTSDPDLIVAEGLFVETSKIYQDYLAWSQERLDQSGFINVDHYLVGGTVYGSPLAGYESAVVTMLQEITAPGVNPGDPPIMFSVITLFELAPDEDAADEEVEYLSSLYYSDGDICLGDLERSEPTLVTIPGGQTPESCAAQHALCDSACRDDFIGGLLDCGGYSVACGISCWVACGFTGPYIVLCRSLCAAACVAAIAGCIASKHRAYSACKKRCQIAHMQCDPDYVPPCLIVVP